MLAIEVGDMKTTLVKSHHWPHLCQTGGSGGGALIAASVEI